MMSLEQARKLLPEGDKTTDDELSSVLADAYTLAHIVVDDYLEKKKIKHDNE